MPVANRRQNEGPRPDYVFCHAALPQVALEDPLSFLGILASPKSLEFLASLLQQVEKQCGSSASFTANDIGVMHRRLGDHVCVVLEFPDPAQAPDPHFVALLAQLDFEESATRPTVLSARFFTLEKSEPIFGGSGTVLGEWSNSTHGNYGDGPPPVMEEFISALSAFIS